MVGGAYQRQGRWLVVGGLTKGKGGGPHVSLRDRWKE